jgi:hypothetical protein
MITLITCLSCLCALSTIGTANASAYDNNVNDRSWHNNGKQCVMDSEGQRIFKAYEHLKQALKLARTIPAEDARVAACRGLEACKNHFLSSLDIIAEETMTLNENIGEILCECDDDKLRVEILYHVNEMANEFDTDQE